MSPRYTLPVLVATLCTAVIGVVSLSPIWTEEGPSVDRVSVPTAAPTADGHVVVSVAPAWARK